MSPEKKALIRATWQRVAPISDAAAQSFYDRLFEFDPRLRALFEGVDLDIQRRKLVQALAMVVGSLDRIDTLIPIIEDLGRRHATYGVADAHYESVGVILISTLQQCLGDAWTEKVKAAWVEAYTLVSSVMRAGAAKASAREAEGPMSPLPPEDAAISHLA
jgi:hemoglobin-like flavoprotein